jgi:tyrosine-protein kinase Etk/Wzc
MCASVTDLLPVITTEEKENSTNFRDILNGYLYHWPLFFIGLSVAIIIAFVYMQKVNPVYTIKASIIIKDEKKEPDEKRQLQDIELSNSPKLAENEVNVLKSRSLIDKVVNDLQLWITYQENGNLKTETFYKNSPIILDLLTPSNRVNGQILKIKIKDNKSFFLIRSDNTQQEFSFNTNLENTFGNWRLIPVKDLEKFTGEVITITLNNLNKTSENYQKAIDVDLPDKLAPTIELTLKDEIETRGKDILDYLIKIYNENNIAEKNQITKKTLDFIDNRITSLTNELNSSESAVQGYRSSQGLTDISSQSKVYLQNQQENDNKLNSVNVKLNIIDGIEKSLNSSDGIKSAGAASLEVDYPNLSAALEKLSQALSEREIRLANVPESNPIFNPINRMVKFAKADVESNIQSIKTSLLETKRQLQAYSLNYATSIRDIPVQERELLDRTRRQSVKENLYTYLLQKREEVSLNYASILPDAKIVDYAYAGSSKTSMALVIYGVAFLSGVLIPAGFIYSRKKLSNRVTSRKEIENATHMPLFGELTYTNSPSTLISLDKNITSEEFRDLRTNLHFLKKDKDTSWVTLVTSSIANEGKSFTSSNLGHAMAVSGKKTVILEMDMRKPKIIQIFGLIRGKGISDFLTGQSTIEEIVQPSNLHPKLDIIGSGTLFKNPSELLEDINKQKQFFNWLRSNYDEIIIDTPPVNLVTDAKILSQYADTILYVVRQAYTYKSLLSFISSLIRKEQFSEMKIVFNGVQKERYGYGYDYGSDYYQPVTGGKKIMKTLRLNDLSKRF